MTPPRVAAARALFATAALPLALTLTLPLPAAAQDDVPLVDRISVTTNATLSRRDIENIPTRTDISLLTPRLDVNIPVSSRFEVKVPIQLSVTNVEDDDTFTEIDIAILPGIAFGTPRTAGVISLGPRLNRFDAGNDAVTRFGGEARLGGLFRLTSKLRFEPSLSFTYFQEKEDQNIGREQTVSLNLGLRYQWLPGQDPDGADRPDINLYKGYGLRVSTFGDDQPRVTQFDLPQDYLGFYVGAGNTGQLRIGGEVSYQRTSQDDASASYFFVRPTLQYFFSPEYRTSGSFFVAGRANVGYQSFDLGGSYNTDDSITQFGVGGEIQYAWPWRESFSWNVGVAFDRMFEKDEVPASNTFAIRAGMSYYFRN